MGDGRWEGSRHENLRKTTHLRLVKRWICLTCKIFLSRNCENFPQQSLMDCKRRQASMVPTFVEGLRWVGGMELALACGIFKSGW